MTRTLTILAAAASLALSATPAWATGPVTPAQPGTTSYTLSNTMISGFTVSKKPPTQALAYTLSNTMVSGYSVAARTAPPKPRGIAGTRATNTASATTSRTIAGGPAPSGTTGSASAGPQGLIMRDGGICDPIRHMGC